MGRRGFRLAFLVVLAATVVAQTGAAAPQRAQDPAPTIDWVSQPHLNTFTGWFRVLSNHQTFGGVVILPERAITTPANGQPTSEASLPLEALWSSKCSAIEKQKATFTRKINLPGHPEKLQLSMWAYSSVAEGRHPITSIAVNVNGSQLHKVFAPDIPSNTTRTVIDLPASAGSAFKYGENTITMVATKKLTAKKARFCSYNRFGVAMELAGEFTADVTSTVPHGSEKGSVVPLTMTVTNAGPSDTLAGYSCPQLVPPQLCGNPTLSLWAVSQEVKINHVVAIEGTLGAGTPPTLRPGCTESGYGAGDRRGFIATCPMPQLSPGEGATFTFAVAFGDGLAGFRGTSQTQKQTIFFGYGAPGFSESIDQLKNNGEQTRTITIENTTATSRL